MGFEWIHAETTAAQERKLTIKVPVRKSLEIDDALEPPIASPHLEAKLSKLLNMNEEGTPPGAVQGRVLGEKTGNIKDFYTMGKELGRGHFGVVRMCEEIGTSQQFACKSIDKCNLKKKEEIKELQAEIGVMQHLTGHVNVVQLADVFEDQDCVHLVMELCKEGDLFDYIARKRRLPEPEAAKIFRQLLLAVQYCHSKGVIHRDLKPENVLFAKVPQDGGDFLVKLADFGLAVMMKPGEDASGLAGSPFYMAPELVRRKKYNVEIDVWSLGVILYTAVSGFLPFWGKTHEQTFAAVCRGEPDFVKKPWHTISPEAKSLVRKMLTMDVKKRATIEDVLNHPWILAHCPNPRNAVRSKLKPLNQGGFFSFQSPELPAAPQSPRDTSPSRQPMQQALSAPKGRFSPPRTPSPVTSPRAVHFKPSISQFLPTPPGTPKGGGQSNITPFAAALTKPFRMLQRGTHEEAKQTEELSSVNSPIEGPQTTPRPFFLSEPQQRQDPFKRELILERPLDGSPRGTTLLDDVPPILSTGPFSPQVTQAGASCSSPRSPLDKFRLL